MKGRQCLGCKHIDILKAFDYANKTAAIGILPVGFHGWHDQSQKSNLSKAELQPPRNAGGQKTQCQQCDGMG